jgi:hypothetical protein
VSRQTSTLEESGYALGETALSRSDVSRLRAELDRLAGLDPRSGGIRGLGLKSDLIRQLAEDGPPAVLAREALGQDAVPVKITGFDKTPGANWKVPWHQDLTIAVSGRLKAEGFGPWTVKDGIPHVQPPAEILSGMLAIRVHLDDTPADQGALRVIPGSHRLGRIPASEIPGLRARLGEVTCPVAQGGMMLMRPLLLHASSKSHAGEHRRVIHIEYAAFDLPFGLRWAEGARPARTSPG